MLLEIHYSHGEFNARAPRDELRLRAAKWRWCAKRSLWYTKSYVAALRLRDEMGEGSAKDQLSRKILTHTPWPESPPFPPELKPKAFQIMAAKFALARNRSYLALDPGLGKTIVAALIANALHQHHRGRATFVYMCPPFMVENVREEMLKWRYSVKLHPEVQFRGVPLECNFLIFPDSMLNSYPDTRDLDDLTWSAKKLGAHTVLMVDEAQRFGQLESMRTESLLGWWEKKNKQKKWHMGVADLFDRIIWLSGSPVQSKTMELFPILDHSAPETIGFANKFGYGARYGGMKRNAFGKFEFKGSTRTEELKERIQPAFMLRLRKDKLKLPPKVEELLIVAPNMSPKLTKIDKTVLRKYSPADLMEAELKEKHGLHDLHLATYRRLLGLEKVEPTVEVVKGTLDYTDEAMLLFGLHTEVVEQLAHKLSAFKPIVVTGKVPVKHRLGLVKEFQSNKKRPLFIGNIDACGVGFTLTKATQVIIAEPSYVPTKNDQASDRAHRIGQTDSVYVRYIVFKNSHDRKVIETNLKKRNAINTI